MLEYQIQQKVTTEHTLTLELCGSSSSIYIKSVLVC